MFTLYVIGVGPGDPELLTLKAVTIIKKVPIIFVPKGREDGRSLALSIVSRIVDLKEKEILELHFPMIKTKEMAKEIMERWETLSKDMVKHLNGSDAAFLTLGDPCLYSTFFYLYPRLKSQIPDLRIEIVPGVSSITACAAAVPVSLGLADERIAIIPSNYFDFDESIIGAFDTIVFMKVERKFKDLTKFLESHGLIEKSLYVSRVGMEGERIIRDIRTIKDVDLDYFSMLIVKRDHE